MSCFPFIFFLNVHSSHTDPLFLFFYVLIKDLNINQFSSLVSYITRVFFFSYHHFSCLAHCVVDLELVVSNHPEQSCCDSSGNQQPILHQQRQHALDDSKDLLFFFPFWQQL